MNRRTTRATSNIVQPNVVRRPVRLERDFTTPTRSLFTDVEFVVYFRTCAFATTSSITTTRLLTSSREKQSFDADDRASERDGLVRPKPRTPAGAARHGTAEEELGRWGARVFNHTSHSQDTLPELGARDQGWQLTETTAGKGARSRQQVSGWQGGSVAGRTQYPSPLNQPADGRRLPVEESRLISICAPPPGA